MGSLLNLGPIQTLATAGLAGALAAAGGLTLAWSQVQSGHAESGAQIANVGIVSQGTPACASCHGVNGEGVREQNGPRLAGLDAAYLKRQLDAFKHGRRESSVMAGIARSLNDQQRAALARYYASLPPINGAPSDERGEVALGRTIAADGDWSEKVPPCASCHGADGLGVNSMSPPLAGQRSDYIVRQMNRFRQNERRDDALGLMRGIANRLTQREIRAVAAYYQTLPPRPAPHPAPPQVKPPAPGARP